MIVICHFVFRLLNLDYCNWNVIHGFMQTKHLCVLIHIWTKGEVGAQLNWFKPSSKYYNCTDRSKAVLLLWIIYVISVLFCYAFMHVCLLMLCGRLLGKSWPLGSRLWCLIVMFSLSHWYPGSGMVLECIDSWSLSPFLLWLIVHLNLIIDFSPCSHTFWRINETTNSDLSP